MRPRPSSGPHPAYTAAVILRPNYAREQLEVTLIHRDTYMTALVMKQTCMSWLSVCRMLIRYDIENLLTSDSLGHKEFSLGKDLKLQK